MVWQGTVQILYIGYIYPLYLPKVFDVIYLNSPNMHNAQSTYLFMNSSTSFQSEKVWFIAGVSSLSIWKVYKAHVGKILKIIYKYTE